MLTPCLCLLRFILFITPTPVKYVIWFLRLFSTASFLFCHHALQASMYEGQLCFQRMPKKGSVSFFLQMMWPRILVKLHLYAERLINAGPASTQTAFTYFFPPLIDLVWPLPVWFDSGGLYCLQCWHNLRTGINLIEWHSGPWQLN